MNTKELIALSQFLHSHNLSETEIRDTEYLESLIENFKEDYNISLVEGYKVEEREKKMIKTVEHLKEEFTISHPTKGDFYVTVYSKKENHTEEVTNIFYMHENAEIVEDVELLKELNQFILEIF